MSLVAKLATALADQFPDTTVVPNPVDVVPTLPSIVIYPDSPYVVPGTFCKYEVHVQVAVFQSRLNDREALDIASASLPGIAAAVNTAGGEWQEMTMQPSEINGATYLAALHNVVLYDY